MSLQGSLQPSTIGDVCQENAPVTLAQRVQAQLVGDLSSVHGVWQILLVGKHQQDCVAQLVLQPQTRLIYRPNARVRSLLVLSSPQTPTRRSESICLAAHIPCSDSRGRRPIVQHTSLSIRCSSSRASPIRSRSLLSTTKMSPWVFWK